MSPVGGDFGVGQTEKTSLTLWFRSLDALSRSLQLSPLRELLIGQTFAWSNPLLGFCLPYLFTPT
ncbi:MAG: hypothetical protein GY796_32915 [Chloroflexi bacterium]|nr:hypothetical protein [Chloroflexota bacterium]